jgi:hypothetical protein
VELFGDLYIFGEIMIEILVIYPVVVYIVGGIVYLLAN